MVRLSSAVSSGAPRLISLNTVRSSVDKRFRHVLADHRKADHEGMSGAHRAGHEVQRLGKLLFELAPSACCRLVRK